MRVAVRAPYSLAAHARAPPDRFAVLQPLLAVGGAGKFNTGCRVRGGGGSGQAGAIRLALSRALVADTPEHESVLRNARLLKADGRRVERKKPGRKKARKRFQWVKR